MTAYGARIDRAVLDDAVHVRDIVVPANVDVTFGVGFRCRAATAIAADGCDVHGAFSALSPLGSVFWIPSVHRVAYDFLLSRRSLAAGLPVRLHPYHRGRLQLERSMLASGGYARLLALTADVKSDVMRFYGVPEDHIDVLAYGFDPETSIRAIGSEVAARRVLGLAMRKGTVSCCSSETSLSVGVSTCCSRQSHYSRIQR
ncbi:MAG TPA: hypothetical protein VFY36_04970 [Solirubrobacteraceae bacterium]|nr:hypothetical protein [Solirubrobacteraceae bacterium]